MFLDKYIFFNLIKKKNKEKKVQRMKLCPKSYQIYKKNMTNIVSS